MLFLIDLDDTLYLEETYVLSAYRQLSEHFSERDREKSLAMYKYLEYNFFKTGRNGLLENFIHQFKLSIGIESMVNFYREIVPKIALEARVIETLEYLSCHGSVVVVTDGAPVTQRNKIKALKLYDHVDDVFICQEHGYKKPSVEMLIELKHKYRVENNTTTYMIGDDPHADMQPSVAAGIEPIRILYGKFRKIRNTNNLKYCYNHFSELKGVSF